MKEIFRALSAVFFCIGVVAFCVGIVVMITTRSTKTMHFITTIGSCGMLSASFRFLGPERKRLNES